MDESMGYVQPLVMVSTTQCIDLPYASTCSFAVEFRSRDYVTAFGFYFCDFGGSSAAFDFDFGYSGYRGSGTSRFGSVFGSVSSHKFGLNFGSHFDFVDNFGFNFRSAFNDNDFWVSTCSSISTLGF